MAKVEVTVAADQSVEAPKAPPYEGFKEYPKWAKNKEGESKLVQDLKEELEYTGKEPKDGWK